MNEYEKMDAYFRACNYLSVGQIYLKDNPFSVEMTLHFIKKSVD